MAVTETENYAEGRAHGALMAERYGVEEADATLAWLDTLDPKGLYQIAFRRSLNEHIANSLA